MALVKIPARDIVLEVESSTPNTWVEIEGLTSATPNPGENEVATDSTDFDGAGKYSQRIMQRGSSLGAEGHKKLDNATGAKAPGQGRVEAVAKLVGEASIGRIRFRYPMETQWTVWNCTMSLGQQGGGTNDLSAWAATFVRDGDESFVAVV